MGDVSDVHTNSQRDALKLVHRAVGELRRVVATEGIAANQTHVVEAAIMVEDALRLLRGTDSGRDVILKFLKDASPGEVPSNVLRHASGIQEFARRIRELRDEGYDIRATGSGYRLARPAI